MDFGSLSMSQCDRLIGNARHSIDAWIVSFLGWARSSRMLCFLLPTLVLVGCASREGMEDACVARSSTGVPIVEPKLNGAALSELCADVARSRIRVGSFGGGPEGHFDERRPNEVLALNRIRQLGPAAVPYLLGEVRCGRRSAIAGFEALGELGSSGVPELISLMNSADTEVRLMATWSIGFVGADASPAVPILIERLRGGDYLAGVSLGNIGPAAVEATPHLIEAYGSSEEPYRRGYAIALSKIGPQAAEVVPRLLYDIWEADEALQPGGRGWDREAVWTRQRLVEALGGFRSGAADAVPYLVTLLEQRTFSNLTDLYFVKALIRTLGEIGPSARDALPVLESLLHREFSDSIESHFGIKQAAARSIEMIQNE